MKRPLEQTLSSSDSKTNPEESNLSTSGKTIIVPEPYWP